MAKLTNQNEESIGLSNLLEKSITINKNIAFNSEIALLNMNKLKYDSHSIETVH